MTSLIRPCMHSIKKKQLVNQRAWHPQLDLQAPGRGKGEEGGRTSPRELVMALREVLSATKINFKESMFSLSIKGNIHH